LPPIEKHASEFDAAEGRGENEGRVPDDTAGMPKERKGNG